MSETVEEEAADEVRQHCELLVENGGGLAWTAAEGVILMQAGLGPRGGGGAVMARRAARRDGKSKATVIARRARKEQLRSGKAVKGEVTQHGFDAQRKTGGGGRPVLMASQQMERTAELQDPEVRAELNRRIRECERKCFASGRLGSIQQAHACARQQATREQVKSQECVSRGSSTREQENPEVRGGVSIADQSGSTVLSQGSTTSNSSYPSLIAQPTTVTTGHREKYPGNRPPTTIP
jgi:hypothetical protein